MKNPYSRSYLCFLAFLTASLSLCAQAPSSIYLDSRDVANYIRNIQDPYIDASKVKSMEGVTVFPSKAKQPLVFPPNRRLLIPGDGDYTLVLKLQETDTVFVVGRQRRFITYESPDPDTINLVCGFKLYASPQDPHISFRDSIGSLLALSYGPTDASLPLKAATKLAYHLYYRKGANQIEQIPLDELQLAYADNPFMAKRIMTRRNIKALNWNELGYYRSDRDWQMYADFSKAFSKAYPWQAVLDGDSTLQLNQQVSFEDQRASYRDQIISSEKALSLASQQINQTSRQGSLFDARTLAVGMSDFIAERAQEELNLTFFERFKTNMLDTNELTILFPKTRDLLVEFEISNYKTLLSHARTTFETDLGNIGLNFPKILSLPNYRALQNDPNVFNLALIYSLADLAYKEYPIEDILLHACQSLDLRNKELNKAVSLRIVERLLGGHAASISDMRLGRLDTISQASAQVLHNYEEADELIRQIYGELAELADWNRIYGSKDSFPSQRMDRSEKYRLLNAPSKFYIESEYTRTVVTGYNNNESLVPFYDKRIATYLNGRKYYEDLLLNNNPTEAIFEREFTKGMGDPKENYTRGLEYVSQLKHEPIVSDLVQRHQELSHYLTVVKEIEQEFFANSKADTTLSEIYVSNFKKVRFLILAFELEREFWRHFKKYDEHDIAGLEYLGKLFEEKFWIYNILESHYVDTLDLVRYFDKFLLERFKEEIQSNPNQIEQDLGKFGQLLEEQLGRLYLASGRGDVALGQRQLSIKDTFNSDIAKLWEYGQIVDSLELLQYNIKRKNRDDTGYTKLREELIRGNLSPRDPSLLELDYKAHKLTQNDTTYQKLEPLIAEAREKYNKASELLDQKMEEIADNWRASPGGISKDSFPAPDPAAHNTYLPQLARSLESVPVEILDEETTAHFRTIDSLMVQVGPAIERVAEAKERLDSSLNILENQYCHDLVKAKRNAANLHTSMELSMHLLSAFRIPEMPLDSMFIKDSLTIAVSVVNKSDITRSYDSLVVRKKYISDENLKLPGSRWITLDSFNALKNAPLRWDIFLGMLYERLRQVEDAPDFSPTGVALLVNKFFDIIREMDEHRNRVRLKKALREDIGFRDYYPFIKSTVDLFNTAINTPTVGKDRLAPAEKFENIRKVSEISDAALSMYENIYMKNYSNAIRNAMALMSIFTNSEYDPENPSYSSLLRTDLDEAASEKDFKKQSKAQNAKIRKSRRAINAVLTYGTFMADMIDAQTSEQVKNILKSATLPPGSSRIKREVTSNFTINSYLGGAVAYDQLQKELPGLKKGAIGASMSVPVGFTYSFSPDRIFKRGGSFSIHVSLLDLGAITAFRSNPSSDNYQIERLPEFSWRNLFAPGAFFVWNIRNSPFSLGAGGQIGPQLRQITDVNTLVTTPVNSTRFPMVFFSVDVPFFNLHTGAKKIVVD